MAVKSAGQMATDADDYIARIGAALLKLEALRDRLRDDTDFQQLWERDSAQALRDVGIDPDARTEMGYPPYERGPECTLCVTPMGNACHC